MSAMLHYGEGYVKIGLDNDFQTKGKGFAVFLLSIIIGTAAISFLTDQIAGNAILNGQATFLVVIMSIFAVVAILADAEFRFGGG